MYSQIYEDKHKTEILNKVDELNFAKDKYMDEFIGICWVFYLFFNHCHMNPRHSQLYVLYFHHF